MNRRIVIVALVLLMGPALVWADNTVVDGQNSPADTLVAVQDGDGNYAEFQQDADISNVGGVEQEGYRNSTVIKQSDGGPNASTNEACVDQYGDDNEADVTQNTNGGHNTADVKQDGGYFLCFRLPGDRNIARMVQDSIDGDNTLNVRQAGWDNLAEVTQDGPLNNTIDVGQWGVANIIDMGNSQTSATGNNSADIYQKGYANELHATQNAHGDNTLKVVQSDWLCGDENYIWISQDSSAGKNDADVRQFGDDNYVKFTQIGAGDNSIDIDQRGDDNWVGGITPGFTPSGVQWAAIQDGDGGNLLDVYQKGDDNMAAVSQGSFYGKNEAHVDQKGDRNQLGVQQIGNGDNYLDADQYENGCFRKGSDNFAWLEQTTTGCGGSNSATIDQEGDGNKLYGASQGFCCGNCCGICGPVAVLEPGLPAVQTSATGSNTLNLIQEDGGNIVGLYQNACGSNTANIEQWNGGNTAAIYQDSYSGSNSVTLAQYGGDTVNIHQTGPANNVY